MALDATDAEDRVRQLTGLTERLSALLAVEAEAFEARRPQDAATHIEETGRLANLYRHESARIRSDPSLISGAGAEARRRLLQTTQAFEAVLARHGRALAAAKTVTEGLVHAIAQEVAQVRGSRAPYGAGGRTPTPEATAIALNRSA